MKVQLGFHRHHRGPTIFHNDHPSPFWESNCPHMSEITEAVHGHLRSLLGTHTEFYLELNNNGHELPNVVTLPRLQGINNAYFNCATIEAQLLEHALLMPAKTYYVETYYGKIMGELSESSPLFNAESLKVSLQKHEVYSKILAKFNGKRLVIEIEKQDENSEIRKFLNGWKSNQVGRNLEFLRISPFIGSLQNMKQLREAVGMKQFKFAEPSVDPSRVGNYNTRDYIVRDQDKRVASILVKCGEVFLKVWDESVDKIDKEYN